MKTSCASQLLVMLVTCGDGLRPWIALYRRCLAARDGGYSHKHTLKGERGILRTARLGEATAGPISPGSCPIGERVYGLSAGAPPTGLNLQSVVTTSACHARIVF